MTREQISTLIQACLIVLDDSLDRGEVSDTEWTLLVSLLNARAALWLRDATDAGTIGDAAP